MKKFVLLLIFCHLSSPEIHSVRFFSAGFYGMPNLPDFVGAAEWDGIEAANCDSNKTLTAKREWVNILIQTDPDLELRFKRDCFEIQPYFFNAAINNMMQSFNQTEGVHILQRIDGCEWDDETGEVDGFLKYGYDGEDFMSFDFKTLSWVALRPEAVTIKLSWDSDLIGIISRKNDLTQECPHYLKRYANKVESYQLGTVLPSVSLLQKSPSSPVTCHATGFYPDRAVIFWRRDGEELFEDVEHGEILPNHDGSFQMSVDLLRLPSEDWRRYECVFQLDGVKEDIVTKLHKDVIRTNHVGPRKTTALAAVGVLLGLIVFLAAGYTVYKKKKASRRPPGTLTSAEVSSETASTTTLPLT